jgi:hypothetical protein
MAKINTNPIGVDSWRTSSSHTLRRCNEMIPVLRAPSGTGRLPSAADRAAINDSWSTPQDPNTETELKMSSVVGRDRCAGERRLIGNCCGRSHALVAPLHAKICKPRECESVSTWQF